MFVNVDSKMMCHTYSACMITVCHRTKFVVPIYKDVLVITTKPKVEEKNVEVPPFDKGISNAGFEKTNFTGS